MDTITLRTGAIMPAIGFGTWEITPDSEARQAVLTALEAGYRLIDTARIYGNESGVGEAIRDCGLPRAELFITTKLWNDDQGYDRALKACQASLDRLGLEYIDLYLIHWPATSKRHESWRALEELHKRGLIKAAGVSNYTVEHLEELATQAEFAPAVNQVEFHPFIYEQQRPLLEYCTEQDIIVEAYSPITRVSDSSNPVLDQVAKKHGRSMQQIVLRWCLQHGTVPLPRSQNSDHIRSNFAVFDFSLDEDDMQALNSLSDGERVTWDPAGMG